MSDGEPFGTFWARQLHFLYPFIIAVALIGLAFIFGNKAIRNFYLDGSEAVQSDGFSRNQTNSSTVEETSNGAATSSISPSPELNLKDQLVKWLLARQSQVGDFRARGIAKSNEDEFFFLARVEESNIQIEDFGGSEIIIFEITPEGLNQMTPQNSEDPFQSVARVVANGIAVIRGNQTALAPALQNDLDLTNARETHKGIVVEAISFSRNFSLKSGLVPMSVYVRPSTLQILGAKTIPGLDPETFLDFSNFSSVNPAIPMRISALMEDGQRIQFDFLAFE